MQRIGAGEALGRKIKEAIGSGAGVANDFGLLVVTLKAIEDGGGDSHLRELRGLVLHERDQRRDYDRGALGNYCGQLVAEDLPPPVGMTTQVSRPASNVRTTRSCSGRKESYPQ